MIISEKKARELCLQLLTSSGLSHKDASIVSDGLLYASLRGIDSHGVRLLSHYVRAIPVGRINPKPRFHFSGRGAVRTGDADHGLGLVAGYVAMNRAITLAKRYGIGVVSLGNSSHFGAAGFYTHFAAEVGMIGQASTHVEALALPYNGKKPFLGTNAFSWAAPIAGEAPVVLDMATTDISFNKLKMYKAQGKNLEHPVAADAEGNPTMDSSQAQYLLHFGGYKGYGVAFFVEVFSSMLSGMPFGPHINPMYPLTSTKRNLGQLFVAYNISTFQPLARFKQRMKEMADELRSLPSRPNSKVLIPGDPEKEVLLQRKKDGIPIADPDWEAIEKVKHELSAKS